MVGKASKTHTFSLANNTNGENMMSDTFVRRPDVKDRSNGSLVLQEQLEISKKRNFVNAR